MVNESAFNQPIERKSVTEISTQCYPLPEGYEWTHLDLSNDATALDVYNLLSKHYVEDTDGKFRFDYSIDFLRWALNAPGYNPDWIIGVRGESNKVLYACITAIPVNMVVNG